MTTNILLIEQEPKEGWRVAWRECCSTGLTKRFVKIGCTYENKLTARKYFVHLKYGGVEPALPMFRDNRKLPNGLGLKKTETLHS